MGLAAGVFPSWGTQEADAGPEPLGLGHILLGYPSF